MIMSRESDQMVDDLVEAFTTQEAELINQRVNRAMARYENHDDVSVTIRLPKGLCADANSASERQGITLSELVQRALVMLPDV